MEFISLKKLISDIENFISEIINSKLIEENNIIEVNNYFKNEIKNKYGSSLDGNLIDLIITNIISYAYQKSKPEKIAYLGPVGTFTHQVVLKIFGDNANVVPLRTISEIFAEVESGHVNYGVVPIENSTEGVVTYTLDEFIDADVKIVAEKSIRVSFSLMSVSNDISKINKIYSHPQAIAQCKNWIKLNLPNAEIIQVNSTAKAAETASWDKYSAAIASNIAASMYKLNVLMDGIEDLKNNYTRFLVIGKKINKVTGNDKTSIVCAVKDKPGALYNLLKPFKDYNINMTMIESRPDKKKLWAYNFFIDFEGHINDTNIQEALNKVKEETIFLKILGSYPAETKDLMV